MNGTDDNTISATDVVRFVFLARTAAQRGDHESARRWQAKADAWLAEQKGCSCGKGNRDSSAGHAAVNQGPGLTGHRRATLAESG